MTTVYPEDIDAWQDTQDSDALSTSPDGRDHSQHHNDLQDVALDMETSLAGPVFRSADSYAAQTETLLLDPETTTGWVSDTLGGSSVGTNALHSLGTLSVSHVFRFYPGRQAYLYYNVPVPWVRGDYSYLAVDIRWKYTGSSQLWEPVELYELFASDAADMGGNLVTTSMAPFDNGLFVTFYINVTELTSVASMGIRQQQDLDTSKWIGWNLGGNGAEAPMQFFVDNIRWAAQTEMERASQTGSAIVAPGHTPSITQKITDPSSAEAIIDLRDGRENFSRVGGIRNVRDFGYFIEDGSEDATDALTQIISLLDNGETLEFPPGAVYRLDETSGGISLKGLTDVTLDGRGARIYSTVERNNAFFRINGCGRLNIKNFKINNEYVETLTGTSFDIEVGTPTIASTTTLQAQYDSVLFTRETRYARDHNDQIVFHLTLSDTAQVDEDCIVQLVDPNAPTALTAASSGADGSVAAGTRYYRVTYVDEDGKQSALGDSASVTLAAPASVLLTNIPIGTTCHPAGAPVFSRIIWRTKAGKTDEAMNYYPVITIRDNTTTTWTDYTSDTADGIAVGSWAGAATGTGNVPAGDVSYFITAVNSTTGRETLRSTAIHVITFRDASISMTAVPLGPAGTTSRRIYRLKNAGASGQGSPGNHYLLTEIMDNTTTTYTDNTADSGLGTRTVSWQSQLSYGPPPMMPELKLKLTGTPTVYDLIWNHPHSLDMEVTVRVQKATATANVISLSSIVTQGRIVYHASYESNHGIVVGRSNFDITISDCQIEGVRGDAVTVAGFDVNESRDILIQRIFSRGSGRQGVSFNYGSRVILRDSVIRDCPRSAIDLEPETGDTEELHDILIERVQLHNVTNQGVGCAGGNAVVRVRIKDMRLYGSAGADAINGKFDGISVEDFYGPNGNVSFSGGRVEIKGMTCKQFKIEKINTGSYGGVGYGFVNVQNLDATSCDVLTPNAYLSDVHLRTTDDGAFLNAGADSRFVGLEPGAFADDFSSTYKGTIAGTLWFPRGQDMHDEGMLRTRALSATSTRGNNLSGIDAAVTATATTKTITFPVRSYTQFTSFAFDTSDSVEIGTLAPSTTYYYRVASRPAVGGPILALAEKNQATEASGAGSTNNKIQLNGIRQAPVMIEGATIYRGTTTNVYTVRYDLVPDRDLFSMAADSDANDVHTVMDYGYMLLTTAGSDTGPSGYPATVSPTTTTGHPSWDGAKWTVQDETGWEPDTSYGVMVQTSWNTTWSVTTKRRNGFDLSFGTAAPGGGGTISWMIVR